MEQKISASGRFNNVVSINAIVYKQQKQVVLLYLLITILLAGDRYMNGMLLTQVQPAFFVTPMNVTTWGIMYTGIHQLFIESKAACIVADILLVLLPLIYVLLFLAGKAKAVVICGWSILIFNWVYAQCYVIYPSNSIEGHIGWMLFPVVLVCRGLISFSFALHFIRYFFLFFFVSAAIWKIRNGGIFNIDEMSGILLYQHTPFLVTSPASFLTGMYYWLILHPVIGYSLYLAAAIIELFFIAGFFTLRIDRVLLVFFFVFLIADIMVMRIKYFEVLYLAIPFFFSGKKIMKLNGKK